MRHPLPRRQRRSPRRTGATPSVPRPEDVASVVLMLCEAAPADGELILASIRHGRGVAVSMDEVYVWFDLCSIAEAEGVRLIDWFLIDGESARSMAETTFSEDRW